MKDYQQRNDDKYQALSNYQAHGNLAEHAKRDEEVMFKHIAEREAKETQDASKKRDLEAKSKTLASHALRNQMREK